VKEHSGTPCRGGACPVGDRPAAAEQERSHTQMDENPHKGDTSADIGR